MGPGRLPGIAGLPAHRGQRRPEGLGQVRLREDAGIPLGHPAGARGRRPAHPLRRTQGRAGLAGGAGRIPRHAAPPDRDPGRHRAGLGRAAAPPRQDRAVALRHAQPVPGQRRGGPPPVGDGLSAAEVFRPRRPRGGRRSAAPPSGTEDAPRMLGAFNEETPDWLSFFMFTYLHRPRRQDAARKPGAVGLRSALAHLPLHADRGSAPHVRRRDRRRPHDPAHLRGDEGGRHRGPLRHRPDPRARA